ncbi:hypothetical protein BFW87_01050 [Pseudomonas fluorescens]|uniref:Uncharacterized protein n=1 Tax=Pseudomonas fluorescens TaxID=294 RepID=A0A1T2ZAA3_PSEFL|nr:hypothetical protein [Pseudomonas fluorescens]OPB01018.1 hypothetical protein BFW87_01050 [Pseudomonas fluorescens]
MSLSINKPAFVNVDNGHLDQTSQMPAKLNVPLLANTPSQPVFNSPKGDVTVDAGTLNKLFDMLELVFKALREMFAGKQSKSGVLPDQADLPAAKPEALKPQSAPVTSVLNKPAATGTSDAKAGDIPALVREALKQQPGSNAPRDAKSDTADNHEDKAADLPVTTRGALRPQLGSLLPQALKPEVSVTNEAKANVHVNVNIDHCYCPDTSLDGGRRPKVNVIATIPGTQTPSEATSLKKPDVKHHLESGIILDPEVTTTTPENQEVTQHLESGVKLNPALTTTSPDETESTLTAEHAATSNRPLEKVSGSEQKIVPGSAVEGGQDEVESTKDIVESGEEKVEDSKVEVAGNKDEVGIDNNEVEGDQKVDITSPGPAADASEFRGWNVSQRSNFGA